jgi:hypothetical protein
LRKALFLMLTSSEFTLFSPKRAVGGAALGREEEEFRSSSKPSPRQINQDTVHILRNFRHSPVISGGVPKRFYIGADIKNRAHQRISCLSAGPLTPNIFTQERPGSAKEVTSSRMPTCESSELLEEQAIDNTVVELPADMDRFGDLTLSGTSNELQNGRAVIGNPSSKSISPIRDVPYRGGNELEQSTERNGGRFGKQSDKFEKAIVDATTQDRSTEMFDGTSKDRSSEVEKEGEVGPVAGSVPGQDTLQKRPYCKQCLKAAVVCICASVPKVRVPNRTKLVVLQHYKETKHPLVSTSL